MGHYKSILSVLTSSLVLVGHAVADDISVSEFESGTTISSSAMNANFEVLVDELNSVRARIDALESSLEDGQPEAVFVDANGNVLGYRLRTSSYVYLKLDETDLVMGPIYYWAAGGSGLQYPFEPTLYFAGLGCSGNSALRVNLDNPNNIPSAAINHDGRFVYPGAKVDGNFVAKSYLMVNSNSGSEGELVCRTDEVSFSPHYDVEASITMWQPTPALPYTLRWRSP